MQNVEAPAGSGVMTNFVKSVAGVVVVAVVEVVVRCWQDQPFPGDPHGVT